MQNLVVVYKPRGLTPLEMITRFRNSSPLYKDQVISYAGRLDPMAEGILLLLVGEENKKRETYENLEKTYTFDVLFGITTDTYDVLGKIQNIAQTPSLSQVKAIFSMVLPKFIGKQEQPYPPFSSFHINKKPLFYWAREGKLDEVTIPTKTITIHSLDLLSVRNVSLSELGKTIIADITTVQGDFRQNEILSDWRKVIEQYSDRSLPLATLSVTCTSGTYVRSLADHLGRSVGCGAIATRIVRTRVGNFTLDHARTLSTTE